MTIKTILACSALITTHSQAMEIWVITNDQKVSSHHASTIREINALHVTKQQANSINAPMCNYQELSCVTDAVKAIQNGTFKQHYDTTRHNNSFAMLINTAHKLQAMKVIDLCVSYYFPQEIQPLLCADMIKKITTHIITHQEPEQLSGHPNIVKALALTDDDKYLISGSDIARSYTPTYVTDSTNNLLIWDYAQKTIKHSLKGHRDRITAINITPDNKRAITGDSDIYGSIHIWDIATGMLLHSLVTSSYPGHITALALSSDNKTLVTGLSAQDQNNNILGQNGDTGTILIWNTQTRQINHTIIAPNESISALALSKDGKTIFSGGRGHTYDDSVENGPAINVWDTENGTKTNAFHIHFHDVNELVVSNDGKIISGGFYSKRCGFYSKSCNNFFISDATTGEIVRPLLGHTDHIYSVAINKDNSLIAAGSRYKDNSLFIYDAPTGEILYKLGKGYMWTVAFSNDGNKVITGGNNSNNVCLWTINSPELLCIKNQLNIAQIKLLYRWYCMQQKSLIPTLNQHNGDVHIYNSLPESIQEIAKKVFFVELAAYVPEKEIEEYDFELDPSMFVF